MIEYLPEDVLARMSDGYCPDCGHRGFVLGPRGGAATNIECGECRQRFNVTQGPLSHHIMMAHRIPSEKEGGGSWRRE